MPYYETWDEFVAAAKELFAAQPLKTRLVTKFRHQPVPQRRSRSGAAGGAGTGAGTGAGAGGGKSGAVARAQDLYDGSDKPRGVLVVKVTDDVVVSRA